MTAVVRIGMKLDTDFDRSEPYQRLYQTTDVPARLRTLGIDAVEMPVGPDTDLDDIAAQARRCQRAGLAVSFHPYSEAQDANPAFFAGASSGPAVAHVRFLELAARIAEQQGNTVVNIHPAAVRDDDRPRRELVQRSVEFFAWTREWCDANAPDVRPVAELQVAPNADEPVVRIGDDPAELADVVTGSRVGACWDVGHAVHNHRRFATAEQPTDALLDRIAHVHCHDVDDIDHRVPRRGDAPWRRFLQRLAATGYDATVIIEVVPPTFLDAGGLSAVEEAIAAVSDAVGATPQARRTDG